MPKLIDHAERRVAIAEAAWRVVLRDGVAGVSVRVVAAEAGLATASLRHTFPTQESLLAFCFELVLDRAANRIASIPACGSARAHAEQAVLHVLPLDAERHGEMQVWIAFTAASMVSAALAPVYARGHDDLRELCRSVVSAVAPCADLELESAHLHALIDGLAMHLVSRPQPGAADTAQQVIRAHLNSLG